MNRIGILLCGGVGSRLGQITKAIPKSLVPVYDKPLVDYQLELFEYLGIKEIIIITRPDTHDLFVNYLYVYSDWNDRFVSINIIKQEIPAGIAQAYMLAEKLIPEGWGTVLGLGDNIFHFNSDEEKLNLKKMCDYVPNFITTIPVKDPTQYGVVKYDTNNAIVDVVEKPLTPPSNHIVPGLYFFDDTAVEKAKTLTPSPRGELEITDLQRLYIKDRSLSSINLKSVFWYDCGTTQDLLDANNFMKIVADKTV
jgi:glucose-1-phosphate thymidylyltransferase